MKRSLFHLLRLNEPLKVRELKPLRLQLRIHRGVRAHMRRKEISRRLRFPSSLDAPSVGDVGETGVLEGVRGAYGLD